MTRIRDFLTPPAIVRCILLLFLVIFALSSLIYLIWSALNPFPRDVVEGSIVLLGRMLAQGEAIYRDVSLTPYVVNPYNPLHTVMIAALVKIFGVSFIPCKIFSLLLTLIVAILIFMTIRLLSGKSYWALIFSLVFLMEPGTIYWGASIRIDMMAIAFSLGALYLYVTGANKGIGWICLLLLCAFFTKQSSVAALLAITIHLFAGGEKKKAILLFGSFALSALALMTILNVSSGGHYFFSVVTFHLLMSTSMTLAKLIISSFLKNYLPMLILTLTSVVAIAGTKGFPSRDRALLMVFYLAILLMQSSTVFKTGASHNHFLELNALCCILTGLYFASLFTWLEGQKTRVSGGDVAIPPRMILSVLGMLLLVIQVFCLWGPAYLYRLPGSACRSIAHRSFPPGFQRIIDEDRQVMEAIKSYPDPIWSENVAFLLLSDREIIMGEPFGYTYLPPRLWDFETLLSYFRDQRFSLVILGDRNLPGLSNRLQEQAFAELQKNYVLKEKIGPYNLFIPSGPSERPRD
jgi:hypothetical protein